MEGVAVGNIVTDTPVQPAVRKNNTRIKWSKTILGFIWIVQHLWDSASFIGTSPLRKKIGRIHGFNGAYSLYSPAILGL
jgi:hypothetical protein